MLEAVMSSSNFFPFLNSQLFGHLSHISHHVYMVLLENYLVQTSQPLKSSKPKKKKNMIW